MSHDLKFLIFGVFSTAALMATRPYLPIMYAFYWRAFGLGNLGRSRFSERWEEVSIRLAQFFFGFVALYSWLSLLRLY